MMYRRNAAQTPRISEPMRQPLLAAIAAMLPENIFTTAWNEAWREHRRRTRFAKRNSNSVAYGRVGLNGPRAVARRLAAIERTGRLADGRVVHLARWLEKVA